MGVLLHFRLGHESLDVTLAYLKGKDAESEEAQEHANSGSLALHRFPAAQEKTNSGRFLANQAGVSRSHP